MHSPKEGAASDSAKKLPDGAVGRSAARRETTKIAVSHDGQG